MKWFKHDTDASMDAKLQEVMLDYGLEGYGLYWYCIELIAGKVDAENLTFSLEHDARIIARNTGSTTQKVTEMMTRFVSLGLFQDNDGLITCLRLAKRLNKSMTSNPEMRKAIENMNKNHDSIMTQSGLIMQEENRVEENRVDNKDMSPAAPVNQEKKVSKQFVKPTPTELVAHFESKGSNSNEAENFFNFYESKGWMVGKNKMKIWKSSASLWISKNNKDSSGKQLAAPSQTLSQVSMRTL